MKISEFRRLVDEQLVSRGLTKTLLPGDKAEVYAIPSEDVVRFFKPHSMRRPWGCNLLGDLGIILPRYAQWLDERGEDPIHARLQFYISNDMQFMKSPAISSDADLPALDFWVMKIHRRLKGLPATERSVATMRIWPFGDARFLMKQPEFWNHFSTWRAESRSRSRG